MEALLRERRLLYVTGKGGVGKTTVAAALGLAAAAAGRRTIVCEVAEQDRVSRAFRREGVVAETEVELAENLWAITIDPQRALEEWLARQVGGAGLRVLARSSAFQYFVAAAPGAKELITIAKVWELAQTARWDRSGRTYDLVVVDAPASGHGLAMLTTPRTFGEIARVGPIRRQAFKVRDLLSDPEQTGYVAVALPEEMPVNETLELERRLPEAVGAGLEAIVVNGMWPERFTVAEAATLRADGLPAGGAAAVRAALTSHERARAQRSHLRRLRRAASARVVTLPYLFESEIGLPEFERLAGSLARKL
jgi:anion-transporting  ArsA/GET3 family ATPase